MGQLKIVPYQLIKDLSCSNFIKLKADHFMSLDQTKKIQPSQANQTIETISPVVNQTKLASETSNTPILPEEIGGFNGPEPTRYGDWEKNGRCVDF